jgi:isocitrate lyase
MGWIYEAMLCDRSESERLFAFGYTGDYDYPKAGFSPEAVKSFPSDLAKMGVAWQVQPIWALQRLNYQTEKFAKLWRESGIEGYIEEVQKPALYHSYN